MLLFHGECDFVWTEQDGLEQVVTFLNAAKITDSPCWNTITINITNIHYTNKTDKGKP